MEARAPSQTVQLPAYADIVRWPDFTLIAWRKEARAELDRNPDPALQRRYDASTQEVANRTQASWLNATDDRAGIMPGPNALAVREASP